MVTHNKRILNNQRRGMKLLPQKLRQIIPPLYGQEQLGSKAVIYIKYFCPSNSWSWYATEGSAVLNDGGQEVDFHFFGLVDGFEKELGYFSLAELEGATGPMGLPIERDLYFKPMTLDDIAPELFEDLEGGR